MPKRRRSSEKVLSSLDLGPWSAYTIGCRTRAAWLHVEDLHTRMWYSDSQGAKEEADRLDEDIAQLDEAVAVLAGGTFIAAKTLHQFHIHLRGFVGLATYIAGGEYEFSDEQGI